MLRVFSGIVLATLLVGCQEQAEQAPTEAPNRPVKIHTVSDPNSSTLRSFPAEVVANQGSYLAFRVNGELIEFPVLAGQDVQKGQLLAKLDPEDFNLQYEQRKAQFELAKSQLSRIEPLFEKGIATKAEFDKANADKQVAESAFKIAKTNLEYSELRAPFSGTVAKVFVKNYENVVAKQNILRFETRDMMDVVIQVPERIVARVDKDSDYKPTVVFDGYPSKSYPLTIKEWDTQADPATLTYKVVFSLPIPEDFNLFAGMTGHVYVDPSKITNRENTAIIVPNQAVFSDKKLGTEGNSYVWVYQSDKQTVTKREVTVGQLNHTGIEVLSGLEPGEEIVAAGVHYLQEGAKVRPWTKERGL